MPWVTELMDDRCDCSAASSRENTACALATRAFWLSMAAFMEVSLFRASSSLAEYVARYPWVALILALASPRCAAYCLTAALWSACVRMSVSALAICPPRLEPNLSTPAPASLKELSASFMDALMARMFRVNSPASRDSETTRSRTTSGI